MPKKITVFTIGHSTRPIKEFISILETYKVRHLVDIRSIPRSFFTPQFNQTRLKKALEKKKIKYTHLKDLGGLRHARKDSINKGWRNASFRGYADYMQTKPFEENLNKLIQYAKKKQIAIMCAEAVPWRCHRSLVGDALLIRGYKVIDIFSKTIKKPHKLTSFAKVRKKKITYPSKK